MIFRICEFLISSVTTSPAIMVLGCRFWVVGSVPSTALGMTVCCWDEEAVKFSTSLLTILPFSPEPFTWERLIPLSLAICFANGEAKILPLSEVVVSWSGWDEATGAGVSVFATADASPPFE